MRNFDTKKDIILDAALRVTVKNGSPNFTIREVAREAGLNIAAINYYFNSKEQLIAEMDNLFTENFNAAFVILDQDLDAETKLINWLNDALEYAVHYPGIVYMLKEKFFSLSVDAGSGNLEMAAELFKRIGQVKDLFDEVAGLSGEGEDDFNLFTMFAASVVWPFVTAPLLSPSIADNMSTREQRDKYFRFLINHFKK